MLKSISKENILYLLFFTSLILFDNDINSKVIIAIAIISLFRFTSKNFKNTLKTNYPLLLFFFVVTLSLLYTTKIDNGIKVIESFLIIPASILMFSFFKRKQSSFKHIAVLYIFVVLIATIYSHTEVVLNFMKNNETSYKHFFNLNYSYKALANTLDLHPTYYSLYILTANIFILHLLTEKTVSTYQKILLFIIFLYYSIFIVHLSSRMPILVLYLIIMLNLLQYIRKNKKTIRGLFLITLFHSLAFFIIMNIGVTKYRFQHLLGFTYYTGYTVNDSNHKIKLWSAAIKANHNIIIGNGIGDIQSSLNEQYKEANLKKPLQEEYNSHNQYIQYYVGMGIIGLSVFLYVLFYYARNFVKNKNAVGFQFILIVAIISFTECLWNRHNGIVFIVFMLLLLEKTGKNGAIDSKPLLYSKL